MLNTRRSAGEVRNNPITVADVVSRDRAIIATCLAVITALAWLYLIHLSGQMSIARSTMVDITATAWTLTDYLFTFGMWATMMIGMMTPTAAPALLLFDGMQKNSDGNEGRNKVLLFGLGYIVVWIAFSALAALAQGTLHERAILSMSMATTSTRLSGWILVLAGAYQLTPFKTACLRQCRTPLGFLMTNWRDGKRGALMMGLKHGKYCLGCCWAMMLVLFVVGVMNLAWVAALTALILLEKFGSTGVLLSRAVGAGMIILGIAAIL